jgi:hypothetical protein
VCFFWPLDCCPESVQNPNVIRRPGHSGIRGDSPVNQPWREQYVLTGHGTGAEAGDKTVSARRSPASLCARKESRREERERERESEARPPALARAHNTHARTICFHHRGHIGSTQQGDEIDLISLHCQLRRRVAGTQTPNPTVFVLFFFFRSPPSSPLLFRIKSSTLLLLLQNKVFPRSLARNTKPDSLHLGTYLLLHWSPASPSSS